MADIYIYPCNINFYDVTNHFYHSNDIIWRKTAHISKGDIVYIYVGKPYLEVKYKCTVVEEMIDGAILQKNLYAIPKGKIADKSTYMKMELECIFPDGTFTLPDLKRCGMRQFMVPMHAPASLVDFFISTERKLCLVGGDTDAD